MQLDRYEFKEDGIDGSSFKFVSEGPKGKIIKLVQFEQGNYGNLYNLAFGDLNGETGELDDKTISDNRNSKKVLATVVDCVYAFTNKNPDL